MYVRRAWRRANRMLMRVCYSGGMRNASLAPPRPEPDLACSAPGAPSGISNLAVSFIARAKAVLAERSDDRIAQIAAGNVFLVRVLSALIALGSQVLLARWMGRFEYGVFIYVWTWVLMIGSVADMGLSSSARRFIPEYTERGDWAHLRGFLSGSCWLAFAIATALGAAGALAVYSFAARLDEYVVLPLYLACATIPIWGLGQVQTGIAQSYEWPNLALVPFYIVRQVAMTLIMGAAWWFGAPTSAVFAMLAAFATSWIVTLGQGVWLQRRLRSKVSGGQRRHDVSTWLGTSLPIFVVEGFYLLLTYVDILALEHLGSPQQVATYFAGARLLAVVAFVYYAISGTTMHRFTQYYVAGDIPRLQQFFAETARWTFWPSVALCVGILALGKPLLSLFGAGFEAGYSAMLILAFGMLARAAVGPAERLLNMLGDRRPCALIYLLAFMLNLALCVALIPHYGIEGAAAATSAALTVESILLYVTVRRGLRHHAGAMRSAG
jgi:O-antigen/teichoic acid export membrane protein